MKVKLLSVTLIVCLLASSAFSFGPAGHRWVGAISDRVLIKKKYSTIGQKVRALLLGMSLATAANLPDKIKGWDKIAPDQPKAFHLVKKYEAIEKDLIEFWRANPPRDNNINTKPSHHWFHYTDITVFHKTYNENEVGASKWDIVHLIPYCIGVLKGTIDAKNERKITKPVAIILLAHYLGDIHQPLHVGAEYFNSSGKPVDPNKSEGFEDEGGNGLTLTIPSTEEDTRNTEEQFKLHGFWDGEAVEAAMELVEMEIGTNPAYADMELEKAAASYLSFKKPDVELELKIGVEEWAKVWADEILPIAIEAHERLKFTDVDIKNKHGKKIAVGFAQPKDESSYRDWAGEVTEENIHRAGWRLAVLLSKIVK